MDEQHPAGATPTPPPFDWSRWSPTPDPLHASGLPRPVQMPSAPPVAPTAAPPSGPPTFGAPPPPAATPPSPRGDGGGGSRHRHPAHRARIAAAVVSGLAFAGLVGCAALTGTDDTGTDTGDTQVAQVPAGGSGSDRYGDSYGGSDDQYGGDPYGGSDDQYGSGEYGSDPYGGTSQGSPPQWGGPASPGSGSGSGGPSTRSQAS